MTNYIFQPPASFGIGDHPFTTWDNAFTEEEVEKIIAYCDTVPKEKALLDGGRVDDDYRRSQVAWIGQSAETAWFFDRMAWIARQINGQFYRFDIYGFCEDMQYTMYDEENSGCYEWHIDSGTNASTPRKLSLVLQLTDPDEYEGGDLQLMRHKDVDVVSKKKGLVAAFPSYTLHRVTPLTKGHRKTIVVWVGGPQFR